MDVRSYVEYLQKSKRLQNEIIQKLNSLQKDKNELENAMSIMTKQAEKERVFSFRICDFLEEFRKISGKNLSVEFNECGAFCGEGDDVSKADLLKKFGDKVLEFEIDFLYENSFVLDSDFLCKMTDVLSNGKRIVDVAVIEAQPDFLKEKKLYLMLLHKDLDPACYQDLIVSVNPYKFTMLNPSKEIKEIETAVVNASLKHYERTHGQGKE